MKLSFFILSLFFSQVISNCVQEQCSGLTFELGGVSSSFADYHVVSFGSVAAFAGDIEGRLAAHGNVNLGSFSIGASIDTSSGFDNYAPYALIASSLTWSSGALYPDGTNSSEIENAFVGSSSQVASYLQSRITGSCNDSTDCLATIFDNAYSCYTAAQSSLANQTDNVEQEVGQSLLQLTCSTSDQSTYYVTLTSSTLQSATYFNLSNCNSDAQWIINIAADSGSVSLSGASFPVAAENIIYNILGSERTIFVDNALSGSILSPSNYLNQSSGVIDGNVVVAGILDMRQINKPDCSAASASISTSTSTSTSGNSDVVTGSSVTYLTGGLSNPSDNGSGDDDDDSSALVYLPSILFSVMFMLL